MNYHYFHKYVIINIKIGSTGTTGITNGGGYMSNYLYTNIVEELEESIRSGKLSEGMKLPSERALAEEYGVSRNVVREAYKIMSEKGIVDIQIGKGAFVCAPKVNVIFLK